MTQELVISGSRKRFTWHLVLGAGCLTLSYWVLVEQHMWLLGGLGVAFFGSGLVVMILMMRPGGTYLRLDSDGFEIVAMKRRYRYAWGEVDGFFLGDAGGAQVVGIQFNASCQSQRVGRALAKSLTGMGGALANIFALPPAEVCRTLNEWKARHGQRSPTT